jgi:hypothetical protein
MILLNHSLVQNTHCLGTLCTPVRTSRLEKLATHSVFHTDTGLNKDTIGSVDSEHLLPLIRPAGKLSGLQVSTRESQIVFAVLLAVYASDVPK